MRSHKLFPLQGVKCKINSNILEYDMDKHLGQRLQEFADSYYEFLKLSEEEKKWLLPLMSRESKSTIKMLEMIADSPKTFEEIAFELNCNVQTVTQKLNALAKGGFPIELTDKVAFAPTGRPRKLAKAFTRSPL